MQLLSINVNFLKLILFICVFESYLTLEIWPEMENEHGFELESAKCRYHCLKSCQFSSPLSLFCDVSVADQLVKNPPAMQETLGQEDPLEKG